MSEKEVKVEDKKTEDKKTEGKNPKEIKKGDTLVVEVDRSPEVEAYSKELQEKEVLIKNLQEEFAVTSKQLQDYETDDKSKDEKYTNLETQYNEARDQLKDIAHNKFLEVKAEKLDILKNAEVPEERIQEFEERIQTPADLDSVDWMLATLADSYIKSQTERKKTEDDATAKIIADKDAAKIIADKEQEIDTEIKEDEATIPTNTPSNPPKHSQVTTPVQSVNGKWEYESPREAVDDLYEKVAYGGKDAKEAKRLLDSLWDKFATTLKRNQTIGFGVSQCPLCGAGILQDEKCPYCEFDPIMFKAKGGELWVTGN